MATSIWHFKPDLAQLQASLAVGMALHLGITFADIGDDWIAADMPVDDRSVQPYGRLHGGASVALAETVASVGGMLTLDPEEFVAVGMEINANHVRPVGRGRIRATARPEALQRTTQVWSIRITDDAGKLICISRCTLAILPRARAQPDT